MTKKKYIQPDMMSRESRMIQVLMGSADGIGGGQEYVPSTGGGTDPNNPFGAKDRRTPDEEWDEVWDIND